MSLGGDHAIDWPSFDEQIEEEALRADADSVSYFLETQRETLPPYTNQMLSGGNAVPPVIETSVVENAAGHLGYPNLPQTLSYLMISINSRIAVLPRMCSHLLASPSGRGGDNPIPLEALARMCGRDLNTIGRIIANQEKWVEYDIEAVP
ncbi:hypothetical protein FRB94_011611 [Tulasnella sp. JGI-2019a]|nr:hypothetical protein FRB94_011611 [Tulasnella sp. JGI-2019a]